ncbi:hypothetical protein R50073_45700 [Maricurvus nonylphenolicus]
MRILGLEINSKREVPSNKKAWCYGIGFSIFFTLLVTLVLTRASDTELSRMTTALVISSEAIQSRTGGPRGGPMSSSLNYKLGLKLSDGTKFNAVTQLRHEVGDVACIAIYVSKSKGYEYNKTVQPRSWCKNL